MASTLHFGVEDREKELMVEFGNSTLEAVILKVYQRAKEMIVPEMPEVRNGLATFREDLSLFRRACLAVESFYDGGFRVGVDVFRRVLTQIY